MDEDTHTHTLIYIVETHTETYISIYLDKYKQHTNTLTQSIIFHIVFGNSTQYYDSIKIPFAEYFEYNSKKEK